MLCLWLLQSQAYVLASPQAAAGQFSEAKKLVTQGKFAEAEAPVRAFIARQPSADGFDLLGYICEQQNKLDQAEAAYGEPVKLNPASPFSKIRLGIVYGKKGKYAECVAALEKVRSEIRESPEALFYLCRGYFETGDNVIDEQTELTW